MFSNVDRSFNLDYHSLYSLPLIFVVLDGCIEVNVNYDGNDIPEGLSTAFTWQHCQNHCGTNTECTHWTFRKSDGNCWLKSANDVKTIENDLVSGPRECPGK